MTDAAPSIDLRLIVVTDAGLARPRSLMEVVEAALDAGAPAVQLRRKGVSAAELHQLGLELRTLTRAAGALLFINDRVDVALAVNADGAHLGPTDLPIAAARRAVRAAGHPDFILGASTDDPHAARQLAADGADYIGCGAVFGTTSKRGLAQERIGPHRLRDVVDSVPIPVIGIGGITSDNVQEVAATGARGAAVIGAVMTATDIGDTVQRLLDPFPLRTG